MKGMPYRSMVSMDLKGRKKESCRLSSVVCSGLASLILVCAKPGEYPGVPSSFDERSLYVCAQVLSIRSCQPAFSTRRRLFQDRESAILVCPGDA